jgi:hypothetical protein
MKLVTLEKIQDKKEAETGERNWLMEVWNVKTIIF